MIGRPVKWVVDASVGIKLFVSEPLSDRADALFAHLAAEPSTCLYVPDLFFIECANVLWKYVRHLGYPLANARRNLFDLTTLTLRRVATTEMVAESLDIAMEQNISAYDACYVALAHRVNAPLVTADEKLVRKLAGTHHPAHWLGDFQIQPSK